MKKMFLCTFTLLAILGICLDASAYTRNTYDQYGNKTGSVKSVYPGITSRYDANGKKIGTYVTNQNGLTRGYDKYGRQTGVYSNNMNGIYGRRNVVRYNNQNNYGYARPAYGYYR